MEIKQRRLSTKNTFTFNDESLNFSLKDKSGSDDLDINYAAFPEKSSTLIEQNEWLRNVGILWCLLGCYNVGTAISNGFSLSLSGNAFWLVIGLICLGTFALTKTKYSVFKTEAGKISVIKNKSHDIILSEIYARKKIQLLKWYGDINLENELENEINKFNWLVEQKIMSKVEAEEKIAQVEFAHKADTNNQELLN